MEYKITAERPSNYDVTRDSMEQEFLQYDQEAMIRKFSLRHDGEYLYLPFAGRDYRISRSSGRVEWQKGAEHIHADFNESMVIFDMLAWSKPECRLSGTYVPTGELKGVVSSSSSPTALFSRQSDYFAHRCEELARACLCLGGEMGGVGDVACTLPLFDFFPVRLQFWDADEEFGATLRFLWDENSLDFMHFETIAFATGHLLGRLKECMEREKQ